MRKPSNLKHLALVSLVVIITSTLSAQNKSPERGFITHTIGQTWEEGLISGNGTIGANVLGNPINEKVIFTHERLFLPKGAPMVPKDQSNRLFEIRSLIDKGLYKEAENLQFNLSGQEDFMYPDPFVPAFNMEIEMLGDKTVKNYYRSVNFENGESTVGWDGKDGSYTRKLFVSKADNRVIMKIKSSNKGGVNCSIKLSRIFPESKLNYKYIEGTFLAAAEYISDVKIESDGDYITYRNSYTKAYPGSIKSVEGVAYVVAQTGKKSNKNGVTTIVGADEVLVFIDLSPVYSKVSAVSKVIKEKLASSNMNYDYLLDRHFKIHGELFNRVKLDLGGGSDRYLSTEELFAKSSNDNINNALLEKEFDAGRYNIISCSGELPPVLQGLWAGTYVPDWASDYTHNGNVPSAIAALLMGNNSELMLSYTSYIESLIPWMEINAKNLFGCRGIVLPSRSTTNAYNNALAPDFAGGFWLAGAAWAAHFFYDYYLYTGDLKFLKERALPFMEKAALFFEDFLYVGKDGKYIFSPTQSPENTPSNTNSQGTFNSTMDVAAAKELLQNLITSSKLLSVNKDKIPFWSEMLTRMPDYMIDENGMFKEWLTPLLSNNDAHRHSSQLYPLYDNFPSEFSQNNPLLESVRKSVNYKLEKHWKGSGYGFMSFGLVQLGLVGASIGDKEIVHESLKHMVNRFWLENMASMHNHKSLFNMDISGGMPAVIIKMLVYSDPGLIRLLPALPDVWENGEINGVACRGQIVINSLKWTKNSIDVTMISGIDQTIDIVVDKRVKKIKLLKGKCLSLNLSRGL